jgi:hypothetical protein
VDLGQRKQRAAGAKSITRNFIIFTFRRIKKYEMGVVHEWERCAIHSTDKWEETTWET